jgi:hypothetical protein
MSRDKKNKKEDADFELEADTELSTEPINNAEQEIAAMPSQEDETQPEQRVGKSKSNHLGAEKLSGNSNQKIDLEKVASARPRAEKKAYKEKVLPPTSEEIYKALKKPDGFGFARKILLVAILAAGFFYGQRFWQRTKELVPFPDTPVSDAPVDQSKSLSGQIEDVKKAVLKREQTPSFVDAFIDSDLVDIQVFVNDNNISVAGQKLSLEVGKVHKIEIKRQGFSDYQTEIIPEAGKAVRIQPQFLQEVASGFLTIETTPESKLTIFRDNQLVHEGNTPIAGLKVPTGKYRVVIENQLIGYKSEEDFTIYKSITTNIRRELQAK